MPLNPRKNDQTWEGNDSRPENGNGNNRENTNLEN